MKRLFLIVLLLLPLLSRAQFTDDFSDGDFTKNPVWVGDNGDFTVYKQYGSKKLVCNPNNNGTYYLSTNSTLSKRTQWQFYLRHTFSLLDTAKIYLISDTSDLTKTNSGYFLQWDKDSLKLIKKVNRSVKTLIAKNIKLDSGRILISRDPTNKWSIYADANCSNNFSVVGNKTDNDTLISSSNFGIVLKTSGSNNLYFDDFKVERFDNSSPGKPSVIVIDAKTLVVKFDKEVMEQSCTDSTYYNVIGFGHPNKPQFIYPRSVLLTFTKPFDTTKFYRITINGSITNIYGTTNINQLDSFRYHPAATTGLITINELYPDFSDSVGLPNDEYAELYNASGSDIDIANWKFSDTRDTGILPQYILKKDSFVVLCRASSKYKFRQFPNTISPTKWPTLNNGGDIITLFDSSGKRIDQVHYDLSWYHDAKKQNGGWALERIDPTDTCTGIENWKASVDSSGGTPGKQNSVYGTVTDTTAPTILSYKIIDSADIQFNFSEKLNIDSALKGRYFLNGNIAAVSVRFTSQDFQTLLIKFPIKYIDRTTYTFKLSGIQDCHGNMDTGLRLAFTNYIPVPAKMYDVIFNEIMADPSPVQGLPDAEYLELYNRGGNPVNLKNWKLGDTYKYYTLPDYIIPPDSFLILCKSGLAAYQLMQFGNVLIPTGMPDLNNAGDSLYITDSNSYIIDYVNYSPSWHGDEFKKNGGWSLELIDPNYPCYKDGNWTASVDKKGGTPGKPNSVRGTNPDKDPPQVLKVIPQDSLHITVFFNKPIDTNDIINLANYKLSPDIKIDSANINPSFIFRDFFSRISLILSKPLKPYQTYEFSVSGLKDCSGNLMQSTYVILLGLPLNPEPFDIVINEVLYHPKPDGVDFIELYNRSNKVINLAGMQLASLTDSNTINEPKVISSYGYILMPSEYVVLTTNADIQQKQYFVKSPEKIEIMPSLPSFPDNEGSVVLLRKDGLRLDQLQYSDKWHYPLLNSTVGVSLEKINPDLPTQNQSNWHSAASTAGFATPTYQNSQYQENPAGTNNKVSIETPVFSPDDDGYQDVLNISYKTGQAGYTVQIDILDASGRYVRKLANNETLATEGILHWDGLTSQNEKAPIGIYIIVVQLFNLKGDVEGYKIPVTLAGGF